MWCPFGGVYEKSAGGSRAECEAATKAKGFPFYYWITTQAAWARCLPINYDIDAKLNSDPNTIEGPDCVYVEGFNLYSPPYGNHRHDLISF